MSKVAIIIVTLAAAVISFVAGWQSKKCKDCTLEWDRVNAEHTRVIDSLELRYSDIIANIKPVTNEPETITKYVTRRYHLQRAAGLDSSERVLWADPQ